MADDLELVRRARADVGVFASELTGEELYPHQLSLARSTARIVCALWGRQAGKSRTLAVLALWCAFRTPGFHVLITSAGEDAAKDLLAEISRLASSPLLSGSVVDDMTSTIVLSSGSWIRSVPQSEGQVRGKSIDLLIFDEACYGKEEVLDAARWTMIARPGSRLIMCSTPRGRRDRFFARHYFQAKPNQGMVTAAGGVTIESFHNPSTASPLVEAGLIDFWRSTEDYRKFAREVLAEWIDEAGQYFTAEELDANVAPFTQLDPERAGGAVVAGGIDWGGRNDSNALVLVGALGRDSRRLDRPTYAVALAAERLGSMNDWARDIARWADPTAGGFSAVALASEMNGVGTAPTELLQSELGARGVRRWVTRPVWTTNAGKANGFGRIRILLEQGRLILPDEPALRRQLEALEFQTTEAGNTTIAVPSAKGHDDLAMALCQAARCLRPDRAGQLETDLIGHGELLTTPAGAEIHERPRFVRQGWALKAPSGTEAEDRGW